MYGSRVERLLHAPLALDRARASLGDALWLYVRCLALATTSGHACRTRALLAGDLGTVEEEIDRWVSVLVDAHLVSVVSPAPFLVLKLSFWSGSPLDSDREEPHPSSNSPLSLEEVPGSGNSTAGQSSAASSAIKQSGEGGPGEGATVRARLLALYGDAGEVEALLARVPLPVVTRALRRLQLTPSWQIKKSRLALFRFLVAKYHHTHDATP